MIAFVALAIFVFTYVLIVTEWVSKTLAALIGAVAMLLSGVLQYDNFWHLIDFRTIGIVFGLSVVVSVSKKSNIFSFIAIKTIKMAKDPKNILTVLVILTTIFSTFLANISSIIIMVTLTFIVCKSLKLNAKPFIMAESFATNIGGLAMIVSSIPNVIVASESGLSFILFSTITIPLMIILTAINIWFFRRFFYLGHIDDPEVIDRLDEWSVVEDRPLFWKTAVLIGITLTLFILSDFIPFSLDIIAISCAIIFLLATSHSVSSAINEVDWETLIFFMGLFIMVGALENVGILNMAAEFIQSFSTSETSKNALVFAVSAVTSGIIDNIPLAAAMAPVVGQIASGVLIWFSLVFAANLGGNLTTIGSPTNVIAFGIAKQEGIDISFFEYIKKSGVLSIILLGVSFAYLLFLGVFIA